MADGSGWLPSRARVAAEQAGALFGAAGPVTLDAERTAALAALAGRRMSMDAGLVMRARQDPNVFVEACGRIEGGRWVGKQAGVHVMWQRHLTAAEQRSDQAIAVLLAPVGMAKSTQVTRWRVVWELGRNPNLRVGIMSATTGLPEKILAGIKGDIEGNPWVHAVFPNLRPGRRRGQSKWAELSLHVDRDDNLPDPSIQVYGLSSKLLGARLDLIVIDDLLNLENTATPYMRNRVWEKVQGELFSRRPPHTKSRIWVTGHVWTDDDAVAQCCALSGASVLRQGAKAQRSRDGRVITSCHPDWDPHLPWLPLAPELWKKEALERRYLELGYAARHMLDNLYMQRSSLGIPPEALLRAVENGMSRFLVETRNPLKTGLPIFVGVDLSTGEGEDDTVITVLELQPNGDRLVLWIESGKWKGPEIRDRLLAINKRFMPVEIAVEANAQQRFIRQFVCELPSVVPISDHETTGRANKSLGWGVRSMAVELQDGRWILPRWKPENKPRRSEDADLHPYDPDVRAFLQGAQNFSPERHPPDHLVSMWIAWTRIKIHEGDFA